MKVENRSYHRNYQELEKFEAGIVLTGAEVKSIKAGNIRLDDAFVKFYDEEPFLVNAEVPVYHFAPSDGYDSRHRRKLLLHRKEIIRILTKIQSSPSLTVAPLSCYNKGRHIKLEIALSKGRRDIEKRKLEKARDVERSEKKEAKEFMKSEK